MDILSVPSRLAVMNGLTCERGHTTALLERVGE